MNILPSWWYLRHASRLRDEGGGGELYDFRFPPRSQVATRHSKRKPVSRRRHRVFCVLLAILALPGMIGILFILGAVTGGRLGLVWVSGNSMEWPRNGTIVAIWPSQPRLGDTVIAYGRLHPANDDEASDSACTFMCKEYRGETLYSTATRESVEDFQIRSKVVAGWRPPWAHDSREENKGFTRMHTKLRDAQPKRVFAKIDWLGHTDLFPDQEVVGRLSKPTTGQLIGVGDYQISAKVNGKWVPVPKSGQVRNATAIRVKRIDGDPHVPLGAELISLAVKTLPQ